MPSFKIAGKSKDDLVAITQIAGLLTVEQAKKMTKAKLVQFLEQENARAEALSRQQTDQSGDDTGQQPDLTESVPKGLIQEQDDRLALEPEMQKPAEPVKKKRTSRRRKTGDVALADSAAVPASGSADGEAEQKPAEPVKKKRTASRVRKEKPTGQSAEADADQDPGPAGPVAAETPDVAEQKPARKKTATRRRKKNSEAPEAQLMIETAIGQPAAAPTETSPASAAVEEDAGTGQAVVQKSAGRQDLAAETRQAANRSRRRPATARRTAAAQISADDQDQTSSRPTESAEKPEAALPGSVTEITDSNFYRTEAADQPPVQPALPEAVEESSPEAAEAASERDEREDPKKTASSAHSGRRPPTDYTGSMTRIPRSRISTRQIRPTDSPMDSQEGGKDPASQPETPVAAAEAADKISPETSTDTSERTPAAQITPEKAGDQTGEQAKPDTVAAPSESTQEKRPVTESGDVQGGVLEVMPDGYGFLRKDNYLQGNKDIYVPPQYIRRFGLRPGDFVTGPVRLQRENDRYQALLYIKDVNGLPPEKMIRRPHFDRLTPIYPDERFVLETVRNELSTRIIDLVAPIGKGQRGMIVSPPKAGKTILLQKIANAVSINNPDTKLIVLLIDERPEEVTDMQRSINGEVVYSTFDKTPENHTKVVELVLERAMRLVELKQDVMILMDSMTRLARAYNLTINPTGRTLSGGLDPGALYGPKRFFGAARNIENGGSLTIIATSLIETGSRMDEVIFEEFKGTGNMEVYLDRKLSEKRIFPAIDINKSSTRREELLMSNRELDAVWTIRKAFGQLDTASVTEAIINLLLKTKNNEHFISSVNVSFNDKNVFEAMRGTRPGSQAAGTGTNGGYNSAGYGSNYRRQSGGNGNDDD